MVLCRVCCFPWGDGGRADGLRRVKRLHPEKGVWARINCGGETSTQQQLLVVSCVRKGYPMGPEVRLSQRAGGILQPVCLMHAARMPTRRGALRRPAARSIYRSKACPVLLALVLRVVYASSKIDNPCLEAFL